MDKQPTLESMNVDEIKGEIDSIKPDTTKEELYRKIDFFVKQLNMAHETGRRNSLLLLEALEQAQTKYKKYEVEKLSFKNRAKLSIKKVLIAWGWYEASYDELKELHFGKTRNQIQDEGSKVS
jgi:hypothetical protein